MPIYAWLMPLFGIAGVVSFLFSGNLFELLFGVVALIWGVAIYRRRAAQSRPPVSAAVPPVVSPIAQTPTDPVVAVLEPAAIPLAMSNGRAATPSEPARVRSAANWFIIPSRFDRLATPNHWVWGEKDLAEDTILNEHFAAVLGLSPPPGVTEWSYEIEGCRELMNETVQGLYGLGVPPRYFPTAPGDVGDRFVLQKVMYVDRIYAENVESLQSIARSVGREATDSDFTQALSGEVYFMPEQYERFHPWFSTEVPDYAEHPERRRADLKYYLTNLLLGGSEFEQARAMVAATGQKVYVIPASTDVWRRVGIEHVFELTPSAFDRFISGNP